MKKIIAYIICLGSLSVCAAEPLRSTIVVNGVERFYYLIASESEENLPKPLLIVLHGGGGSALRMMGKLGFAKLAKKGEFILAFPNALKKNWNDGRESPLGLDDGNPIDDVGFLKQLISEIKSKYPVNPEAVFIAGVSNGGMMTFRMLCEDSAEFAASATVIANMPEKLYDKMKKRAGAIRPTPILMMQGTADPLMPWGGGKVGFKRGRVDRGRVVSTKKTLDFWLKVNDCSGFPVSKWIIDKKKTDGVTVERMDYSSTRSGINVVQYILNGGGHSWPGLKERNGRFWKKLREKLLGKSCPDFNATETIWNFFKQHIPANSAELEAMCRRYDAKFPGVRHVTVKEYLRDPRLWTLVDVRPERERKVSMIPGAITKEALERDPGKYRKTAILAYCTVGERSSKYAIRLKKTGFANIANLRGGVLKWAQNGQSFVDPNGKETKRVHVYGRKWNLLPKNYKPFF